jgi:hypothetical protein
MREKLRHRESDRLQQDAGLEFTNCPLHGYGAIFEASGSLLSLLLEGENA